MKEVKIFASVAIGLLILMYALFFAGKLAPIPGLGLIFATMILLYGWVNYRLATRSRFFVFASKEQADFHKEVRWLFISAMIFIVLDIFPHVIFPIFYPDQVWITRSHWLAHVFLFIQGIFAGRVAVTFFRPQYKNLITIFIAIIGISALSASLIYPDIIFYIPISKYPLIRSNIIYAWFNMVLNIASFGLAGIFLLIGGFRSADNFTKTRAILFGIGMISLPLIGVFIQLPQLFPSAILPYLPPILYTLFISWSGFLGAAALYSTQKIDQSSTT